MSSLDYYEVLNISADADEQTIKKSYRKLALKYHPDKNSSPDAADKFKDISEAYEILSDPEKRRVYDNQGSDAFYDNNGYSPFAGFQFHRPEDIFASVFEHINAINNMNDFYHGNVMNQFMAGGPSSPFNSFGGNAFNQPLMGHSMMHDVGFGSHEYIDPSPFQSPHSRQYQQQQHMFQPSLGPRQGFSSFTSSSSSSGPGSHYSKSVSTSTRNVNGVVETVKITKVTDENGTTVTEEYGDGSKRINGIEQPRIENNNVRMRNEFELNDDRPDDFNQTHRDQEDFKQRMIYEMERRDHWRRRNDFYLRQQYKQQQYEQQQEMYYLQHQERIFALAAAAAAAATTRYYPCIEDDYVDYYPPTMNDSSSYYRYTSY